MKIKNLLLTLVCGAFLFTACNDDDAPSGNDNNIPENVLNAFKAKYPNAKDVAWENVKGYKVAHFNLPASRADKIIYTHSAWFTYDGRFCQTEKEMTFDQLPAMVKEGLMMYKSEFYPDWNIDDCESVERTDMGSIFVVELEKGDLEREISLSPYGDILKDVLDDDDDDDILPVLVPNELKEALQKLFPTEFEKVSVVEIDFDKNEIEVDILYRIDNENFAHKEIKFNAKYQWISTETDIAMIDFLDQMKEEFEGLDKKIIEKAQELCGVNLLDSKVKVEKKEVAGGISYQFELKVGKKEVEFKVNAQGNLTIEVDKD